MNLRYLTLAAVCLILASPGCERKRTSPVPGAGAPNKDQLQEARAPAKPEAQRHAEDSVKRGDDTSLIGIVRECVEDPQFDSFMVFDLARPDRVKAGTVLAIRRKTGILGRFKVIKVTDEGAIADPVPGPGFGPDQPKVGDELILPP